MARLKSDNSLLIIIGFLLLFGLVVLSSAGVINGQNKFGSSQYYLIHQILYGVLPGIFLFFIFSRIKYKFWQKIAVPFFLLSVALLVLVIASPFGPILKGAQRWLQFGPLSFQPSEILKLSIIIYFAAWFSKHEDKMKHWTYSAAPFFVILAFISLLLFMQPDVGTLIVILFTVFIIYFSAGAKMKYIFVILAIFGVIFLAMIYIEPYRFDRIQAFLDPTTDLEGRAYHIRQAILGIGSGGIFGVGFGNSKLKINFLPEPVGDSIFVILAEELGLVGAGVLLVMLLILAFKLIAIAKYSPDIFSHLFVIGVLVWIIGQAFMNIGAISGLIPLTGIPLPFISYGGTALTSVLAALGIVHNISKYSRS